MERQCKHCGVSPIRGHVTHLWKCITNSAKAWWVAPTKRRKK